MPRRKNSIPRSDIGRRHMTKRVEPVVEFAARLIDEIVEGRWTSKPVCHMDALDLVCRKIAEIRRQRWKKA